MVLSPVGALSAAVLIQVLVFGMFIMCVTDDIACGLLLSTMPRAMFRLPKQLTALVVEVWTLL